jgi:hypothetical protein
MFALAANLASIYQNPTHLNVQPNAAGYPVWTISDVIAAATSFPNLRFQPTPILWSQFLGARQTSVAWIVAFFDPSRASVAVMAAFLPVRFAPFSVAGLFFGAAFFAP